MLERVFLRRDQKVSMYPVARRGMEVGIAQACYLFLANEMTAQRPTEDQGSHGLIRNGIMGRNIAGSCHQAAGQSQ